MLLPTSSGEYDLQVLAGGKDRRGERKGREHGNQCSLMEGDFWKPISYFKNPENARNGNREDQTGICVEQKSYQGRGIRAVPFPLAPRVSLDRPVCPTL